MKFNAKFDIRQNLEIAQAEKTKVELHVLGGSRLAGRVSEVGDHTVLLEELVGKEFYDAVVRIDSITAVEARVRTK